MGCINGIPFLMALYAHFNMGHMSVAHSGNGPPLQKKWKPLLKLPLARYVIFKSWLLAPHPKSCYTEVNYVLKK